VGGYQETGTANSPPWGEGMKEILQAHALTEAAGRREGGELKENSKRTKNERRESKSVGGRTLEIDELGRRNVLGGTQIRWFRERTWVFKGETQLFSG